MPQRQHYYTYILLILYICIIFKVITKWYHSMSSNATHTRGKVTLLYKAKERALRLLSSAIEVFRQAELRGELGLSLLCF